MSLKLRRTGLGSGIENDRPVYAVVGGYGAAFLPSSLGKLTMHLAPSHSSTAEPLAARAAFAIAS